jgi:hypothetical protein
MQKPNATKQLSLYSLVCAGVCILLQLMIAVSPAPFIRMYVHMDADLPWSLRFVTIFLVLVRILPLGILALWSLLQAAITRSKSLMTVILAPVLYVVGMLAGSGLSVMESMIVSRERTEMVAAFSAVQSTVNWFSLLGTASLVLLCCAGAIDLYLTTHTPSDGESSNI